MRLIPRRRRPAPRPRTRPTRTISDDEGTRLGAIIYHDDRFRNRQSFQHETWQVEVQSYVDEGPGVAGWLVDQVGKLLGRAPIYIEEFDPRTGDWSRSEYGPANRIMAKVRTKDGDIHALVRDATIALEGPAETHVWLDRDSKHGWVYGAATSNQIEKRGDDVVIVRDKPDADIGEDEYREVPIRSIATWVWGSHRYPAVPGNQMRRSLPDLRAYAKATRAIERAFDSRLISNGVVAFEFAEGTPQSAADTLVANYEAWAARGFQNDSSLAAYAPFIAVGPKVTHAETGQEVTKFNIEAAVMLLRQWARSFDLPTRWIVEGPGEAKFANEALLREEVLSGSIEDRERRVMGFVTESILRPWARELSIFDRDPALFRARADVGALAVPEDKTADTIAIADRIGVSRMAQARLVGLSEEDLIPLPPGVTEADLWQATLQRSTAPAAVATSPTGRGPGQGIVAALEPPADDPYRRQTIEWTGATASLDDEIIDAEIVPHDGEIDGWTDDDALLV